MSNATAAGTAPADEQTPLEQAVNTAVLCEKYVKIRDTLKQMDDAYAKKTATYRDFLQKIGNQMLEHLIANGSDSVATPAGTFYRTCRKSATIADKEAFTKHVIDNQLWDLADWRANPTAVFDFIEEHKAPPPGVNTSQAFTVGVRKK